MEKIGQIHAISFKIPWSDFTASINPGTLILTWGIITFLLIAAFFIGKRLRPIPGRTQIAAEAILDSFIGICKDALGEDWKKFYPLVVTLFLFILISNWMGAVPGVDPPTSDLNTCLGFGLLVFFIVHVSAVCKKGVGGYIKDYFKPFFFLFPINVIGELGKVVSHSFRLFGNIFGGGIILALAAPIAFKITGILSLPKWAVSPGIVAMMIVLQGFFGLFVGLVQAFVFSMLALTYIAVARD